ncbi:MAG: hypothetical protein QG626_102 [Patescibacteria group bacterium]|nr:hypothetical protein [Patescibacteria group bacterium]
MLYLIGKLNFVHIKFGGYDERRFPSYRTSEQAPRVRPSDDPAVRPRAAVDGTRHPGWCRHPDDAGSGAAADHVQGAVGCDVRVGGSHDRIRGARRSPGRKLDLTRLGAAETCLPPQACFYLGALLLSEVNYANFCAIWPHDWREYCAVGMARVCGRCLARNFQNNFMIWLARVSRF